jgi:hypothetical protein
MWRDILPDLACHLRRIFGPLEEDPRGELRLTIHAMPLLLFDSLMVLTVAALIVAYLKSNPAYLPYVSLPLCLLPGPVEFWENGLCIPTKWRGQKFLTWAELESYCLDGRDLVLPGRLRYRIPQKQRVEVEKILSAKLGAPVAQLERRDFAIHGHEVEAD